MDSRSLTIPQVEVMTALVIKGGWTTTAELCHDRHGEVTGTSTQGKRVATHNILSSLEDMGLVERTNSWRITEKGQQRLFPEDD